MRSINTLNAETLFRGIPVDFLGAIFSALALAFALCVSVVVPGLRQRKSAVITLCALLLSSIFALQWALSLKTQNKLTAQSFENTQGKPRYINNADASLARMATTVKEHVPIGPESRLFLLHNSKGHNFYRLRLQYHLLPLNVHNFSRPFPPWEELRMGDYLLLLKTQKNEDLRTSRQWQEGMRGLVSKEVYASNAIILLEVQ